MPSQVLSSVENNFTKGLVTEFTGLNFPENAATDTSNCEYTIVGDVVRRLGIDVEVNHAIATATGSTARNTYVWTNVGGDGNTKLLVRQEGNIYRFYTISTATTTSPLSTQILAGTVDVSGFVAPGGTINTALESQFADGNGYLFIYRPDCEPIYCTYTAGTVTANAITVQIRDFAGILEPGVSVSFRPNALSMEHSYNLNNQGWAKSPPWTATSGSVVTVSAGSHTFTIATGLTITNGDRVAFTNGHGVSPGGVFYPAGSYIMTGTVTGYSGATLTVNITDVSVPDWAGSSYNDWVLTSSTDYITGWHTAIGNYPSNSDVWWYFKDNTDVFNPVSTIGNVSLSSSQAPQGHYVLNAFNQQRSVTSSVTGLTDIKTTVRPKIGTWFQGRVWYAGVDAQQPATGDAQYYTWSENIYFSQIVTTTTDFGLCFQVNDPTSEALFDLLPTDGGVIQIQGCGSIYKLFPIQNGMLVFATNGIWFITGSQGIGFSANDYTITKISQVQCISSTSFVNVNGLPYFWNEEGIYAVEPAKQGGLEVNPLTVGTILQFYNEIPVDSKRYVRGDYHPIDYVVQWTYRAEQETGISDRYHFDTILNYNTYNKAFFPYTISNGTSGTNTNPFISGINYISYPQIGSTVPDPGFKYPMNYMASGTFTISIADEHDDNYVDWSNFGSPNYESYFVTGYKLHGQGQRRFQIPYIYVFSRTDGGAVAYKIQGLWDYAISGDSGRWSTAQIFNINEPNYAMVFRRHKIRGQGLVLQIKVKSVDGQPFDVMGWSTFETQNTGI